MRNALAVCLICLTNLSFGQFYGNDFYGKYQMWSIDQSRKVQFGNFLFDYNSGSSFLLRNIPLMQLENAIVVRPGFGFEKMQIQPFSHIPYGRRGRKFRMNTIGQYGSPRNFSLGQNSIYNWNKDLARGSVYHTFHQNVFYARERQSLANFNRDNNNLYVQGGYARRRYLDGKEKTWKANAIAMNNSVQNAFQESNEVYGVDIRYDSKPKLNSRFATGVQFLSYSGDLQSNAVGSESIRLETFLLVKKIGAKIDHEAAVNYGFYSNALRLAPNEYTNTFHLTSIRLTQNGNWKSLDYSVENKVLYHSTEGVIYEPQLALKANIKDGVLAFHGGRKWLNHLPFDRFRPALQTASILPFQLALLGQNHGRKEMFNMFSGTAELPFNSENKLLISVKHHVFEHFNFLGKSQGSLVRGLVDFTSYGIHFRKSHSRFQLRTGYTFTVPAHDFDVTFVPMHQAQMKLDYELPTFYFIGYYFNMKLKTRLGYQTDYTLPVFADGSRYEMEPAFFGDVWLSFNDDRHYGSRRRFTVDMGVTNVTNTQFYGGNNENISRAMLAMPNISRQFMVRVNVPVL
jgi:hypothetical protein